VLVLAGLSTGHKVGLAVVGFVFIAFALAASFIAPRRRADFPGRNGLSVFIIACLVLFAAMLTAVLVFGRESEAKGAEAKSAGAPATVQRNIPVAEKEFQILLPPLKTLPAGSYSFLVDNNGKIPHDLVVSGPNVNNAKTPLLKPGQTALLKVTLSTGNYTLYCSVPGHRAAGMVAKLSVG
jgi:plastocyanin